MRELVRYAAAAVVLIMVLALGGCASSGSDDLAFGEGRSASTAVSYRGPELWTVVDYEYASLNLGEEWLFLELYATGSGGASVLLERESIFLLSPAGQRIPLATQREFGQVYGSLRADLRRLEIVRDPFNYFPANRRPCRGGLFAAPGAGLAFDQFTVNDQIVCATMLFFEVPGGVQAGRYVLGIDLEETEVRIPFSL